MCAIYSPSNTSSNPEKKKKTKHLVCHQYTFKSSIWEYFAYVNMCCIKDGASSMVSQSRGSIPPWKLLKNFLKQ